MIENQRNAQTSDNVSKQANMIWNVADIISDSFIISYF